MNAIKQQQQIAATIALDYIKDMIVDLDNLAYFKEVYDMDISATSISQIENVLKRGYSQLKDLLEV